MISLASNREHRAAPTLRFSLNFACIDHRKCSIGIFIAAQILVWRWKSPVEKWKKSLPLQKFYSCHITSYKRNSCIYHILLFTFISEESDATHFSRTAGSLVNTFRNGDSARRTKFATRCINYSIKTDAAPKLLPFTKLRQSTSSKILLTSNRIIEFVSCLPQSTQSSSFKLPVAQFRQPSYLHPATKPATIESMTSLFASWNTVDQLSKVSVRVQRWPGTRKLFPGHSREICLASRHQSLTARKVHSESDRVVCSLRIGGEEVRLQRPLGGPEWHQQRGFASRVGELHHLPHAGDATAAREGLH